MSKSAQVSALYPRKEGSTFNLDYYLSTHMPLVMKHWKQYGFTSYKVTQFAPDAPYSYGVTMEFDNIEGFQKAGQTESTKEIMDDIPNFSSEQPTLLAGETVGTG